jgi:hypothetical protein
VFLERLRDVGIEVYGDNSKASTPVQEIAESVVSLLPRMGAHMRVALSEGTLQMFWQMRERSMQIIVDQARRVAVKVSDGTTHRTHYCAGESSALGACLQKGLDLYLKNKISL